MTIYLYVKQHSVTGLKYFGKTIQEDPYSYKGSGIYWVSHINKHGREFVETIQLWEFEDQEEASKFALKFSEENNIVESNEWANLKPENGSDGGLCPNYLFSESSRRKISESNRTRVISDETKLKISLGNKGKVRTQESKVLLSEFQKSRKRKPHSKETKRKMSEAKLGRSFTVEHKNNIAKAAKNRLKKV